MIRQTAFRAVRSSYASPLRRVAVNSNLIKSAPTVSQAASFSYKSLLAKRAPLAAATVFKAPRRFYSPPPELCENCPAVEYRYADVKKLSQHPQKDVVLVDVREPDEYKSGHIPTAVNIPYKSSPGALGMEAEDFKDTFGFDKPDEDKRLVFYCLAGVRSTAAEHLAATFGYKNRGNYTGSWEDWTSHEQPQEKGAKEEQAKL